MPANTELGKWKQADQKFKASLINTVTSKTSKLQEIMPHKAN